MSFSISLSRSPFSWLTPSSTSSRPLLPTAYDHDERTPLLSSTDRASNAEQEAAAEASTSTFNPRQRWMKAINTVRATQRLSPLSTTKNMLERPNLQPNTLEIPFTFTPNRTQAPDHHYLTSSDNPELQKVFQILNEKIHNTPTWQQQIQQISGATPQQLHLRPFAPASHQFAETMEKNYGDGLITVLDKISQSGTAPLHATALKDFNKLMGEPSIRLQSDSLESLDVHSLESLDLLRFLNEHLPNESAIQNWRIKQVVKAPLEQALKIHPTWDEWRLSAGASTGWSLFAEMWLRNVALEALFRKELSNTNYNKLSPLRRALLGIPEDDFKKIIDSANFRKKFLALLSEAAPLGTAEIIDVMLVKSALARAADARLTLAQSLRNVIATQKLSTMMSVGIATVGTMPEKAKELFWHPETPLGKLNQTAVGFGTNTVSALACGSPFFTEGGPQRDEAIKVLAELYNPDTGALKLSEQDEFKLSQNTTSIKDVQRHLSKLADAEILHKNPAARVIGASVPTAMAISVIPTLLNGATKFLPEGPIAEIAKAGIDIAAVPTLGPMELLALNAIAILEKKNPELVTYLSKGGRQVIDLVHTPFRLANEVFWKKETFAEAERLQLALRMKSNTATPEQVV